VCPFTTLPICIVFKNLAGDIIKQWDTLSGVVVQDVIFWTWRELFMSMLWNSRPGNEDMIQRMIREIEQTYGGCHHIILCGGEPSAFLFPSFLS
jgi:organic radical activating enzyme